MKTALLFPGQGSQNVGMGADFFSTYRESALVYEEVSDITHLNIKKLCFTGPLEELTHTPNLQPCLFATELAIFRALEKRFEMTPVFSAGHSLGEYSAWCAVGSLKLADGAALTKRRGALMQQAASGTTKGSMAAILGLTKEKVEELCNVSAKETDQIVSPANYNAPGQVVIAGTEHGVAVALTLLAKEERFKGGKGIALQVSAPFHCALMKPAEEEMSQQLATTDFMPARFPVISNVTAQLVETSSQVQALLTRQITSPVRWEESMNLGLSMQPEILLELGPGKVLAGLQKRISKESKVISISTVELLENFLKERKSNESAK